MNITSQTIEQLLIEADIEGYIELGAPSDEYSSEAAAIAELLKELEGDEINDANIAAIISTVWRESFDLSTADLQLRESAINNLVRSIDTGKS